MVTALVAFTSATSEQIKEADQIGMKIYAWNDFLKLVRRNSRTFIVCRLKIPGKLISDCVSLVANSQCL
jgi:hypothetical protein